MKPLKFKFVYCLLVLSLTCFSQNKKSLLDSIIELRRLSNQSSLTNNQRVAAALRANELSKSSAHDTTYFKSDRNLSFVYLMTGNYDQFGESTLNNLELATKLNDSIAIGIANKNLGYYYYQIKEDNSTAYKYYLNALIYFDALSNLREQAEILTSIAAIQDDEKDYLGSEQNAIEALKILNSLDYYKDQYLDKYLVLNLLGIVSLKLGNYEESISYHNQAIELTKRLKNNYYLNLQSKNNLAITYRDKGDLETTLSIYRELLEETEVLKKDMSFYALVLENYAFTKFLYGNYEYKTLESDLKYALKIGDSIEDQYTILAVSIDLAKFYKANKKKDSALKYAKESYKISKDIPINDLYLESMLILANLTKGEESKSYLEEHIALSDSLLDRERKVRNKFARIKYGTDQLEAKNKQISKENLYLLILSIGLLLTAILVYLVISQRAKNRKLRLVQVQQKANEAIYNLLLGQQDKVDEARAKEKIRVSKELHDGVLGRLFGARLSLDVMNSKEGKEAVKTRANYIAQLKTIEEDIRKISHELNTDFVAGSGFIEILTELIETQSKAYGLGHEFKYDFDISWDLVPNKTKINMYRIIQESMQNIFKHAEAKTIKISISLEKNVICLDIIDDGIGFDTSKSKKGIGLKNMTSRAADCDGTITLSSQINQGSTINVKIPYLSETL